MAVKHEPEILVLHPGVQIWGSLVCRTNVTDVYAFDFSTAAAPVQKHVRGTVQYCTDVSVPAPPRCFLTDVSFGSFYCIMQVGKLAGTGRSPVSFYR